MSKSGLGIKTAAIAAALSVSLLASVPVVSAGAPAPTPKDVLGHDPGDDYYLASYEEEVAYFHALAASTDRMKLFTAGKTTRGRTLEYAVISAPENIAKFDHYVEISKRLAAVKGLDDTSARALAKDGKIIVHIDGGMHASEVAGPQGVIQLAYDMVNLDDDAHKALRDNVILVLWPTLNPDGMDIVVDWYRKNRGTAWEMAPTPELYQEYVGHDNNRDGYMLNMIESQNVFKAEQEYSPEIWYSYHQAAPFPARIWVPPFSDPMSSNISPYVRTWTTAIGADMMTAFEEQQMPGAIAEAQYDNWYPGFLDYTHVFRNTISFFTEVAHPSATPRTSPPSTFPPNLRDLKALVMYPDPWKGGLWRLADSIRYNLVAGTSVMDTATRYREQLLYNRYQAGRDVIKRFTAEGPYAYVIPGGQADAPEAALLAQKFIDQGLTVTRASTPITLAGQTYPMGSWVIPMDQPFAALVQELFERQRYPDAVMNGNTGKPANLPYDVTGWTLPLQFGVTVVAVTEKLTDTVIAALEPVTKAEVRGGVDGSGSQFALSRKVNASFAVANEAAARGAKLTFSSAPVVTVNGPESDAIVVAGLSADTLSKIAAVHDVTATALNSAARGETVKPARIGLYRPWGSNIDEGWTRWLLEQYHFPFATLHNADVKGNLRARFDTIILPDLRSADALVNGLNSEQMPPPYAGGIGDDGVAALQKFVADGGALVALNDASDVVIDLFDLPVKDVVRGFRPDQFFCSGALLQVKLNAPSRATAGLQDPVVMFERGPAFQPTVGFRGNILASYPNDNPLLSGVLLHPEAIEGKAAALEVEYGKGRVFLYGFRPQWRGQTHNTYKFLFNTLYTHAQPEPSGTVIATH